MIQIAFGAVFSAAVLAGIAYAAFEAIQAVISRSRLIWDSLLDWTGVMIGAAAVNYLMVGQAIPAIVLVISALIIAIIGADRRTGGRK